MRITDFAQNVSRASTKEVILASISSEDDFTTDTKWINIVVQDPASGDENGKAIKSLMFSLTPKDASDLASVLIGKSEDTLQQQQVNYEESVHDANTGEE